MEPLIINLDSIREFWQVSNNVDSYRLQPALIGAQQSDLKPILGQRLYYEMINSFIGIPVIVNAGIISGDEWSNNPAEPSGNTGQLATISNGIAAWTGGALSAAITSTQIEKPLGIEFVAGDVVTSELDFLATFSTTAAANFTINIQAAGQKPDNNWVNIGTVGQIQVSAPGATPVDSVIQVINSKITLTDSYKGLAIYYQVTTTTADATLISLTLRSANIFKGGFNDERFNDLYLGGTYTNPKVNGTVYFSGVEQLLSAYAFGRYTGFAKTNVTRSGVTVKDIEESDPQTDGQTRAYARFVKSEALRIREEIRLFLIESKDTYPEYETREPREDKPTGFDFQRVGVRRDFNYRGMQETFYRPKYY